MGNINHLSAVDARRLLWTGRPAWFERRTDGGRVILCAVNRWKGTDNDGVCVRDASDKRGGYQWTDLRALIRREDCDGGPEPVWLRQAHESGKRNAALEAILQQYPENWHRCACGEPALDGKATCGDVACRPAFMFDDDDQAAPVHRAPFDAANQVHRAEALRDKGVR